MGIAEELARARVLVDEGEQGAARALLARALSEVAPARDVDEACAIAEATALLVGLDVDIEPSKMIDSHLAGMERLTAGFDDARTSEARARAELQRVEFDHGHDELDPMLHVEVMQRARALDEKFRASPYGGVRRAAAEAALTAQMIRRWLGQAPTSIAIALDELALRLGGENDPRMSAIRVEAIVAASRMRIENGLDLTGVAAMLHIAVREARGIPESEGRALDASLLLADLAIADGVAPVEAVGLARQLLSGDVGSDSPHRARLDTRHLERVLERLDQESRDEIAAVEWSRLLERYARATDAEARSVVLGALGRYVGPVPDVTASGLSLLRRADRIFVADIDPGSALARFGIAAKIAGVLGHPEETTSSRPQSALRDVAEAVRVSVEIEDRFASLWNATETAPAMAALLLDRSLRLVDLGRRDEALRTLSRLTETARALGDATARLERAQAGYWLARFLREAGRIEDARRAIDEVISEFADDRSGDVRIWAANALWSAWRADGVDAGDAADLRRAFAERFAEDPDLRVRRLDATRRLQEAVIAHEKGEMTRATALQQELLERFAGVEDDDIQDTVRRAGENLHILELASTGTSALGDAVTERYRSLRDRLYAADQLAQGGQVADAERLWKAIVEETGGAEDVDIAMLRLAALDAWAGWMQDAGYWEQVASLARQATILRSGADQRAQRVQARAHLRLGTALGKLGNLREAVAVYDALDALAADSRDGDVSLARQQAVYNRAVMLDDLGDSVAAVTAYEHAVAVHSQALDSPSGRLRCAKALRNEALLLAGLGRRSEAAAAHRRVIDLAQGSSDPQLLERVKSSAFDLAAAFTSLGDHAAAASTYGWILASPQLALSKDERRAATKAEKTARRAAR